jgi:hypothetical protein
MFRFAIEAAIALPQYQFAFRLHPLILRKNLVQSEPVLKDLPSNVFWSDGTLEMDAAKSRWAIYRGSTAIFTAIGAGCRPIYLQGSEELSIDPLYAVREYAISVSSREQLKAALLSPSINSELFLEALLSIVSPLQTDVLLRVVQAALCK